MRWLKLVLRIVLGVVFLYAAYTKLREPWMLFAIAIDAYHVLPEWAVLMVARTLPWFELLLGILLIAGVYLRYVATAASALLLAFFALMVRSYVAGLQIDCGCFGSGDALGPRTLLRDGSLLAASVTLSVCAFLRPKP
jgi:uncharacterized membrane protein YphA (DoxX/SURF4 family)